MAAVGPLNATFHVFMIVFMAMLLLGLIGYSRRRNLQSLLVLSGLVAATFGLVAETAAALIDGFFIPMFAAHLLRESAASIGEGLQIVAASAIALQILAKFGVLCLAAAILLWSIDVLQSGTRRHVLLGVIGCLAAASVIVTSFTVATTLTSHNVAFVFAIPAVWYLAAGVLMIRERV